MGNHDSDYHHAAPKTLPDWLRWHADRRGTAVALRHKRLGVWEEKCWSELALDVQRLAGALTARGFGPGDSLLLLSHPRHEALLLSLAAQWLGGVAVPIDPTQSRSEIDRQLDDDDAAFVFAEDQQQVDIVLAAGLAPTLTIFGDARGLAGYRSEVVVSYADLLVAASAEPVEPVLARAEHVAFVFQQTDTQGEIRDVSLSHRDLLKQGQLLVDVEGITNREEALAARAFAAAGQARYLLAPWLIAGFCLNFPENLATRDNDRRELGPTLVVGTRETYQRLEQLVRSRLPEEGTWHRWLVNKALASDGGLLIRLLGYWLVRRPLRDVIGFTRTRFPLLVGEPLTERSAQFFTALGIEVRNWPEPQSDYEAEPSRPRSPGARPTPNHIPGLAPQRA